jgi:ribosomal protein L20
MTRVKRGNVARKRRKEVLNLIIVVVYFNDQIKHSKKCSLFSMKIS